MWNTRQNTRIALAMGVKGMQMVRRASPGTSALTTSDRVKLERHEPCKIQTEGPAPQGSSIGEGQVLQTAYTNTERLKVDRRTRFANHRADLQMLIHSEVSMYSWITPRPQAACKGLQWA